MQTRNVRKLFFCCLVVVLAIGVPPVVLAAPAQGTGGPNTRPDGAGSQGTQPAGSGIWLDNFDSYAAGSQMHGQGGWVGWDNNPAAGALVSTVQSRSAPNSVAIGGASDLVHQYEWPTSGQWTYTAWQYIPGTLSGETYFILLNTYNHGGPYNWSVQVSEDSVTDLISNDGSSGGTAALVYNQWVEIRVEIDLTANTQDFYYNGALLYSGTWTEELPPGGGVAVIDSVDLYANNATDVYYDDLSLVPAGVLAIDMSPASQTIVTGGTANFTIAVTNTGSITLTNVIVDDPAVADCDADLGTLNPGASESYSCQDVGVVAGYTNTATVTGAIVGGPTLSASDSAVVEIRPPTAVSISSVDGSASNNLGLWLVTAAATALGVTALVTSRRRRRV